MLCEVSTCARDGEWEVVFHTRRYYYCSYHAFFRGQPRWRRVVSFRRADAGA